MTAIGLAAFQECMTLEAANPQLSNHPLGRDRQGGFDGASAGAGVAAASESLSNLGHVDGALAAQADTEAAIGLFAEEKRNFDALNGERIVDQAFAVFFLRFAH